MHSFLGTCEASAAAASPLRLFTLIPTLVTSADTIAIRLAR